MKKILLSITVCLSLLVVFCGSKQPNTTKQVFSDSFAALNPTDFVTNNVLKSAVYHGDFAAIATIPTNNDFVTKASAASLICIDQSNSYYSALPYTTTFVTKQSLTASGTAQIHTGTLYCQYSDGFAHTVGWNNSTNACTYSGGFSLTFYYNGTFANGITIYGDVCETQPIEYDGTTGGTYGSYFFKDGQYFTLNGSGVVANLANCSGGLTDVYLHITSTSGTTTGIAVVGSFSDAGNTSSINIANASGGYITIQITFEDQYGDTVTGTGTISNGSNTVTITAGSAFPTGGVLTSATITGITGSSSTQNYINN